MKVDLLMQRKLVRRAETDDVLRPSASRKRTEVFDVGAICRSTKCHTLKDLDGLPSLVATRVDGALEAFSRG